MGSARERMEEKRKLKQALKPDLSWEKSISYYEKWSWNISQLRILLSEHPPHHLQHQMLLFHDLLVKGFYKNLPGRRITQPCQSRLRAHVHVPRQMRGEADFPWNFRSLQRRPRQPNCQVPYLTLLPEIWTKIILERSSIFSESCLQVEVFTSWG